MYYEVLPASFFNKSPLLEDNILVYSSDVPLSPGTIVKISIGKKLAAGIIYRKSKAKTFHFKIKPITAVLYETPLPRHLIKSIVWLNSYYLAPLSGVVNLFLPTGILKNRRRPKTSASSAPSTTPSPTIPLNPAQQSAIAALDQIHTNTKLLHGVTGSGKTNIYLSLALREFNAGRSAILLVPEIALTSQLVQILTQTFGHDHVVLIHSAQTEAERHLTWEQLLQTSGPKIIIGPRSALFAPISNLGLIIVDEAHESTYFEEKSPKYSALRLASFIAKTQQITCLFGTATPLIADYYLAQQNHAYVELNTKAISITSTPRIQIIDFKERQHFTKSRYFSTPLLQTIEYNLNKHQQTLIFHNRRGSAPLTICESCGWQALCPDCYLPLTLHSDNFELFCHTCGYHEKVPTCCPNCRHINIIHKGFGTKLLEAELTKLFPAAHISRFDGDNDKMNNLATLYNDVKQGDIDIIIGTQTIARGLDLPHLATVGVIQADAGLSLPDFAAEERTFHLLTQVIGRIGRGHLDDANAIIQTYQPTHPAITSAISADYTTFYNYLIKKRQTSHLPPYLFMAQIYLNFKTEATVLKKIKVLEAALKSHPGLTVSTPMPAFRDQNRSGFTWQLVIKSKSRQKILDAIKSLPDFPKLHFTIDPPSLI